MSEIAEISGYNHLLQAACKARWWRGKATGWARGAWVGGGAWPSCNACLGACPEPSGVPGAHAPDGHPPPPPAAKPQFVMSGCASPTIRPSAPASQARVLRRRSMLVNGKTFLHGKNALRVLCDRFFLLRPGKAIRIHLISEVLVIGDINFIAKPDKYFTLSCSG